MNPISDDQLSAYLDGALTTVETKELERALADSPELQQRLSDLRRLSQLLKSVPAPVPPPDFFDKVLNKTRPSRRSWTYWTVPLVGAAAAALVMVYIAKDPLSPPALKQMAIVSVREQEQRRDLQQPPEDRRIPVLKPMVAVLAQSGAISSKKKDLSGFSHDEKSVESSIVSRREKTYPILFDRESTRKTMADSMDTVSTAVPAAPSIERKASANTKGGSDSEWVGDSSGISGPRQVVIRSAEDWARFWSEHQSNRFPPPPAPEVDFQSHMVVGIFVGDRGSSGYGVHIIDVQFNATETVVTYHETTPDRQSDMGFLAVMTQPYHLKPIPRSDRSVRFVEQ